MKQCEERNHAENQTTDDLGNPVNMQKWGQQDEDSISGKPQFQNGESIFESSYRKSPNRSRPHNKAQMYWNASIKSTRSYMNIIRTSQWLLRNKNT